MNNDYDFAALSRSWQQQPIPKESVPSVFDLTQARQRQQQQQKLLLAEWLGALVMTGTAIFLVWMMPGWLSYISALFLAVGTLGSVYVSWHVHRPILGYANWSSQGVLAFRLRACQLSLHYYRYNQFGCVMLLIFTGILWLIRVWQPAEVPADLVGFYSLIVLPLCLAGVLWLQQKVQVKSDELVHLKALVAEFQTEEG